MLGSRIPCCPDLAGCGVSKTQGFASARWVDASHLQGRSNALKAFQHLEGQGLVRKASSTPDLSRQCDPFQVCTQTPITCLKGE